MKNLNDTDDQRARRRRPQFQSLLDQLDTKIEREVGTLDTLNVLSLRLFALERQRTQLGRFPASDEQAINPKANAEITPHVILENTASDITPTAISKKMTANKFRFWRTR